MNCEIKPFGAESVINIDFKNPLDNKKSKAVNSCIDRKRRLAKSRRFSG